MRRHILLALAAAAAISAAAARPALPDTVLIPERAIVATGNAGAASDLIAILYNRSELHYSDPSAPRFLFVDRKGKVVLGIGGYIKGTLQYDFAGAINDGASFDTYDIPAPSDPAQRSQFFANANHSTVFMQMIGRTERFGTYEMFVQTNFSGGGPHGYDLKLKQAYLRLGRVTAGLTNSTFVDGAAGTPTVDDQGPAGEMSSKNILLQYKPRFTDHLTGAIAIEMPSAGYRLAPHTEAINQRCPDIPLYLQYGWSGDSHLRLSGLLRNLSYRDLSDGDNRFATGWAVQLSGTTRLARPLRLFFQGAYGHGYAHYINDLADADVDLIPSPGHDGKLHAPAMSNFEVGLTYNFSPRAFLAASYSQAHLYEQSELGPDTYKRGQYVSVTGFYDVVPDFTVGLEYLHGSRHNVDGTHGAANRISGMLKISF